MTGQRAATLSRALGARPHRYLLSAWPARAALFLLMGLLQALVLVLLLVALVMLAPVTGLLFGAVERCRLRLLGGPRAISPHVPIPRAERHLWVGVRLSEAATWRELAGAFVTIVLGLVGGALLFVVLGAIVLAVMVTVTLVAGPAAGRREPLQISPTLAVTVDGPVTIALILGLAALVLLLLGSAGAYLLGGFAAAHGGLVRPLVSGREEELVRTVARLARSRRLLVDAFERERTRIERELHDGAQQRLVALSMQLGIIRHGLGPEHVHAPVRQGIDAAQLSAEQALADIRGVVRGLRPAVLADHGLEAALLELGAAAPVPVLVDAGEIGTLPRSVESALYFAASESLSNALRHAAPTRVRITVDRPGERLQLRVSDDGVGGARLGAGSGLAGIAERAEMLGGGLSIRSPRGGPTHITIEIPDPGERESAR